MKLWITDEFSTLKKVVVAWGDYIPKYGEYKSKDPEFLKFHPYSWNKDLLLKQQEAFFSKLEKYKIKLVFPKTDSSLPWQIYTRDTGFVIGDKFFYTADRKFGDRNGEIGKLLKVLTLKADQLIALKGEIEGGDVIVNTKDEVYVGNSSRSNRQAITNLSEFVNCKVLSLGEKVMHLDTRLVPLPGNIALIFPGSFSKADLKFLAGRYELIEVFEDEVKKLGTNVFVINPEVVIVPKTHSRIARLLAQKKFKVETIDYSEPIALGGSFRCTTLPLERD